MWALVCVYWYRQPKKTLSWHWKLKRRMQMLCCGLLAFIFITIFPKPVSEGIPAILTLSFTLPIDTALWTVFNLSTLLLSSIIFVWTDCLNLWCCSSLEWRWVDHSQYLFFYSGAVLLETAAESGHAEAQYELACRIRAEVSLALKSLFLPLQRAWRFFFIW